MFSIIVPSYNREQEIPVLLASLAEQTTYNFEVIIVDDCSKNSLKNDRSFAFPVQIIRNETNQGAAESRNIGARNAKNEWLLFLDDDDRFAVEKCELLADTITQDLAINFIYHPAECIMVNEGFHYFTHPYSDVKMLTLDNLLRANKIGGMPMLAVRKDFFFVLGGLSNQIKSLEDYEFVLKAVSHPDFMPKYVDKPLTQCTFHTQRSSVSTNTENTEKALAVIAEHYVKTPQQQKQFAINTLYMLAYPNAMNLSRKAAGYYWKMFCQSGSLKSLAIALVSAISPKLAINLKRFI